MPTQVIMPQLGESVIEGTVSKWLKSIGDEVDEFEPLLEVNTDKVDSEIPSPSSGKILDILVPEGTVVTAGTLLAWIGETGEKAPAEAESAAGELPPSESIEMISKQTPQVAKPSQPPRREKGLGFISPVVAKISSEHGIDLSLVNGTGQGGRITKKDILAYIEKLESAPARATRAPEAIPASQPATGSAVVPGEILPLNTVRRAIAEHMVLSKHTSPHVSTIMEADLNRVVAHREAQKEAFARDGVNLTFTAYFISAIVAGLKTHPIVNSSWAEDGILIHREINIGMATSLGEAGLIVPVIKNADGLSLLGLARTVNDLANRARNRQLKPDEVKGGTFTITNHGTSGSLFATPIINQPQSGILGVGAIQKRVVVIDDAIAIRPMVYISLTFDHRILDGAIADYFLGEVVKSLQNWG
jgi:pyruvate/2-oxoglutarate dehydrogenase complex dihydrolipoamide acyltransferase (E2) component